MINNMGKSDVFVSVVLVTNNDAHNINEKINDLHSYLLDRFVDYEIVIVDQCSRDNTTNQIESNLDRLMSVRLIELSVPVAHDVAVAAAIENAIGDFVVIFDLKQDPIVCIEDLVLQCKSGSDIVIGVASQKLSFSYRIVSPVIQWLLSENGYNLPRNATNLRCLSRRAVNLVTQAGRFHHQLFIRISKTGLPSSQFEYLQNTKVASKAVMSSLRELMRLFIYNSTKPLRWMGIVGILLAGITFITSLALIMSELISNSTFDIHAFETLLMSIMFMLIFTMFSFFGEYLGRLLDDRGEQFCYSVISEKNSSVMSNENRVNVIGYSEESNSSASEK